ncbi:hypothetical protein LIER_03284 [Lithospermum erythrorhizon]|uniref:Transcription repressor n=1 Tax=Lithospermum erythrorhizon TaxID=34254 RepID=A0AAV3NT18_LITER
MGNFKFRLSNMMPNAWFYKLKGMSKTKNQPNNKKLSKLQKIKLSEQNQSILYTIESNNKDKHYNSPRNTKISDTQLPQPSRKSSRKTRRKTIYRPSPRHSNTNTTSCSAYIEHEHIHARKHSDSSGECITELDFVNSSSSRFESGFLDGSNGLASWASACKCRISSSTADIIIDMNDNPFSGKHEKFDGFCEFSELDLPRIQTRLPYSNDATEFQAFRCNNTSSEMVGTMKIINYDSVKIKKEKSMIHEHPRKSISQSTGVKVRTKSPKLARSKKLQSKSRKSYLSRTQKNTFSESFAVVKASVDPEKDFRDSMMEMIVENNMRTSKELEDLLACFLSLNSDEYHDVIIKAFEQIWFSISEIQL